MRKFLMIAVAVCAAGYGAYRWQASESTQSAQLAGEHDARLIKDRLWLDHIPRNDRDRIQVFAAISQRPRQGPVGVFEVVSMWEGHFQAFRYESHGREMRIVFPQTGERETLTLEASRCDEGGMNYCLAIEGSSRGVKRYYSRKGWELRDLSDVAAIKAKLVP